MSDHRAARAHPLPPGGLGGRHVLAIFLIFFGAIFAVNAIFVALALSTRTGVVAQEPYVKGLHYNARIAAGERQERRGWRDTVNLSRAGRYELALAAPDGSPVAGLDITAVIGRPSTNRFDRELRLNEVAPGRYRGDFGNLDPGNWLITSVAFQKAGDPDPVYRLRRRKWLTP